jgi:DNA-binding LacI/PurR family transcriptional regulator
LILLTFLPLTPADVAPLEQARVPFVLVNRHFGSRPVNCVTFEWEAAAQDAVQRLAAAGHRHLALLLPDLENTSVVGRAEGWRAGTRLAGLDPAGAPILRYRGAPGATGEMVAGGLSLGGRLLQDGLPGSGRVPTAIVGFNDWCALGVLRAAAAAGVAVPGDLSVIGFDNTLLGAGTTPPLSSYGPRYVTLGERAAALLAAVLRGEVDVPQRERVPVDFVARGSVAPARCPGSRVPGPESGVGNRQDLPTRPHLVGT